MRPFIPRSKMNSKRKNPLEVKANMTNKQWRKDEYLDEPQVDYG